MPCFFFQTQHNPQWKPDGSAIGQHWQRGAKSEPKKLLSDDDLSETA